VAGAVTRADADGDASLPGHGIRILFPYPAKPQPGTEPMETSTCLPATPMPHYVVLIMHPPS
jgi:hypothetical protein